MSVSKLTKSPAAMTASPHSWNQGLLRGPAASRRVSIHSPPRAAFTWLRIDHSAFSVMSGTSAARIAPMASSQTATDAFRQAISSGPLVRRASSMTSLPSDTSDRKGVVWGKSVGVMGDVVGGGRMYKKHDINKRKNNIKNN